MTSQTTSNSTATNRRAIALSRRQTMAGLLICALTAIFGAFARIAMSFMQPARPVNSYGGIVEAGLLTDLPAAGSAPRAVPRGRFWLINGDDGISALHSSCTHLECLFSWDSEKKLFVCPCHGSEFSRTGQVMKGPAERDLDRFPIQLVAEDGTVLRDSGDSGGSALSIAGLESASEISGETTDVVGERKRILVKVDTARKLTKS